jgi:hypothetical protein
MHPYALPPSPFPCRNTTIMFVATCNGAAGYRCVVRTLCLPALRCPRFESSLKVHPLPLPALLFFAASCTSPSTQRRAGCSEVSTRSRSNVLSPTLNDANPLLLFFCFPPGAHQTSSQCGSPSGPFPLQRRSQPPPRACASLTRKTRPSQQAIVRSTKACFRSRSPGRPGRLEQQGERVPL